MTHASFALRALSTTLAVALLAVTVTARNAGQQAAGESEQAATTTKSGVYTNAQAARGESSFANSCVGCHAVETYTDATFRNGWNGATVWELFSYMRESMPEDAPGMLSAKEYSDIVAYFLKLNRTPTGTAELPTTEEALKKITIDLGSQ